MLRRIIFAFTAFALACGGDSPSDSGSTDPVTVAEVTISASRLELVPGESGTITATARSASGSVVGNATLTWRSSAPAVASVGSMGEVTGEAPGQATLTVSSGGASATVAVEVYEGGVVTAQGGVVEALSGLVRLEVPAGAVSSTTVIRVGSVTAPPAERLVESTVVSITPASVNFGAGTTLHLRYPAELSGAVVEHRLRLGTLGGGAAWSELEVLPVDVPDRRVAGEVGGGGIYAVFQPQATMRDLARMSGIDHGVAVNLDAMRNDAEYRELLAAEYTSVTPENVMKFGPIHPTPATYDFSGADEVVEFAERWGMAVHGHVLLWHSQQPGWLTAGTPTRGSLLGDLKAHVETVVGRYAGRIGSWDVANETVADDGSGLRPSFWIQTVGADVIDSVFVWAHRADAEARLYLNDYSVAGGGAKADSLFALATRLRDAGIPIHGVGFQAHVLHTWPAPANMAPTLARFAAAGFDVRYTEVDVRLPDGQDLLQAQAAQYRALADACVGEPRCTALTTWGATDRYSWIPGWFDGFGRALPFDEALAPKPAYDALWAAFGGG